MRILQKGKKKFKRVLLGLREKLDWSGDGLGVRGKNLGFLSEKEFARALQFARDGNIAGWVRTGGVPEIPWRTHVCCWAAKNALHLNGDFVECGVYTGLLSMAICEYLEFEKNGRRFLLFDTFEGIPIGGLQGQERASAEKLNRVYFDVYEIAKRNFARFSNVRLIKGILPDSLETVTIDEIAYLSIDLNSAQYEKQTIEALWERLVPGAMVVIDDYAFIEHVAQYEMWNAFAKSKGRMILTVPTGQGLLQK
jgi:hypothetical protein